jgi:hypothetical protein
MRPTQPDDYARDFVEELLRTGITLSGLLADLIDSLPEDAYPGESNAEVVLEMLIGTIRPVAEVAGEKAVRSASALLASSSARTLRDLERAAELAGRREPEARRNRGSAG